MIIKITHTQKDYLLETVLNRTSELAKFIEAAKCVHNVYLVDIDDESVVDEIRELCSIQLQKEGFDENYELTASGEVLEELIDLFFI